jgi:hypothetical protein
MINFSIKLLESNQEIYKKILAALLPDIRKYMLKAKNKLTTNLKPIIKNLIESSPEYNSLLFGQLKYEFGIPNSEEKLSRLLDVWTNNIQITFEQPKVTNNRITTSLSIFMIKSNFSDVIYQDFASVLDKERGYSLPWLKWLLLDGRKVIVPKYEVVIGPNKYSRTGMAVMKKSTKFWKVPSEYSGTERNNWITRAIDSAQDQIQQEIEKAIK